MGNTYSMWSAYKFSLEEGRIICDILSLYFGGKFTKITIEGNILDCLRADTYSAVLGIPIEEAKRNIRLAGKLLLDSGIEVRISSNEVKYYPYVYSVEVADDSSYIGVQWHKECIKPSPIVTKGRYITMSAGMLELSVDTPSRTIGNA